MATALALNDVIQTTIWNQLGEQAVINVLYWKVTNIVGAPTLEGVAADFDDNIAAIVKPTMSNAGSHLGLILRRVFPSVSAMVLSDSGFGAGSVAAEPLGNQTAAVTTKRTAFFGQSGRGRMYWGLLPKTFTTDGLNLTPAAKIIIQGQGDLLAVPMSNGPAGNSAEFSLAIYQAAPVPVTKLVTAMTTRFKLGTQRRRGGTGRPNTSPF